MNLNSLLGAGWQIVMVGQSKVGANIDDGVILLLMRLNFRSVAVSDQHFQGTQRMSQRGIAGGLQLEHLQPEVVGETLCDVRSTVAAG